MGGPRRDDFPNHFVGDLVHTERGWVVVPPTACPDGHDYADDGWATSAVWCTCNTRHLQWRCHYGKSILRRVVDELLTHRTECDCGHCEAAAIARIGDVCNIATNWQRMISAVPRRAAR